MTEVENPNPVERKEDGRGLLEAWQAFKLSPRPKLHGNTLTCNYIQVTLTTPSLVQQEYSNCRGTWEEMCFLPAVSTWRSLFTILPHWGRAQLTRVVQITTSGHLTPHTGLCLENNNLTLQLPVWGSTTTRDCYVVHKGRLRDGDTSESHRTKSDPALRSSSSPTGRQSFSFWRNIHFLDCRFQNLFGKHLWPF